MPQQDRAVEGARQPDTPLPRCFKKIRDPELKQIAQDIYESLKTVSSVLPPAVRPAGENVCPAKLLGMANSRAVILGVQEGHRFIAQELYESSRVRFVGIAAGVLEAVRLGAVPTDQQELFFRRIRRLVEMVASDRFAVLQSRRKSGVSATTLMRAYGISTIGLGRVTLEKWLGLWIWVNRNNGLARIEAIKVTDEDFRPDYC